MFRVIIRNTQLLNGIIVHCGFTPSEIVFYRVGWTDDIMCTAWFLFYTRGGRFSVQELSNPHNSIEWDLKIYNPKTDKMLLNLAPIKVQKIDLILYFSLKQDEITAKS